MTVETLLQDTGNYQVKPLTKLLAPILIQENARD